MSYSQLSDSHDVMDSPLGDSYTDSQNSETLDEPKRAIPVSTFVRGIGMVVVVAGMCSYLLESWDLWNGSSRFFVMLGGTGFLALAGFLLSYILKENKGARAFFGLALVSSLANITTLAGFIYSKLNSTSFADSTIGEYIVDLSTIGDVSVFGMVAAAYLLIVPACWFSFKVLNRAFSSGLFGVFLITSSLLLVPFRESTIIGFLILVALLVPIYYLSKVARGNPNFKTPEGIFTVLIIFAPAVVMCARLFFLYEADVILSLILSLIGFSITRYISMSFRIKSLYESLNDLFAIGLAIAISLFCTELSYGLLDDTAQVSLFAFVFASLMRSIAIHRGKVNYNFASIGYFSTLVILLFNSVIDDALFADISCLIAAGLLLLVAKLEHSKFALGLAGIAFFSGLLPLGFDLLATVDFTSWTVLAGLGVLIIFVASLVEKYDAKKILSSFL